MIKKTIASAKANRAERKRLKMRDAEFEHLMRVRFLVARAEGAKKIATIQNV